MDDSFLNVDASDVSLQRSAKRKANIAASSRYRIRFNPFVAAASTEDEFEMRLALVEADLNEMVREACEEYGVEDHESVASTVKSSALQIFSEKEPDSPVYEHLSGEDESCDEDEDDDSNEKESSVKQSTEPSPKMDKKKWTPSNLDSLPKDRKDGPHPTVQLDADNRELPVNVSERDFDQVGEGVTETQDVSKDVNIKGDHTKTFPKGNQANPITY